MEDLDDIEITEESFKVQERADI